MDPGQNFAARVDGFRRWERGPVGIVLGSGKYGTVFKVEHGAMKESTIKRDKTSLVKQLHREHISGILQSLLVFNKVTPHLPVHFGFHFVPSPEGAITRFYMEEFHGSLASLASQILFTPRDWHVTAFQIISPLTVLANVFLVSHNDLYPRNVLVNRIEFTRNVTYQIGAHTYSVPWPFMLALTDFGLSSSTVLGGTTLPELAMGLAPSTLPKRFGSQPSQRHILYYKELPQFSRDMYTLLKWFAFPMKTFPRPPPVVKNWATRSLEWIDERQQDLKDPQPLLDFVYYLFADWICRVDAPDYVFSGCTDEKDALYDRASFVLESLTRSTSSPSRDSSRK